MTVGGPVVTRSFFAYDASFSGGVTVAAGDVDNQGRADIITGAGPGGGPSTRLPRLVGRGRALEILASAGALGGASDHGVSKSLYGSDPDGNEFEIMWRVPREAWGEHEEHGSILPLDMDAEVRRWGAKA